MGVSRSPFARVSAHVRALACLALVESPACVASRGDADDDSVLLASVCGVFGVLLLLLVIAALREAVAMKRWPIARGRVLSSKVEEYRASAGAGKFGGARARLTLYRPVVVYEYETGGRRLQGSRIAQSPGIDRGVPAFAERTVHRYPP